MTQSPASDDEHPRSARSALRDATRVRHQAMEDALGLLDAPLSLGRYTALLSHAYRLYQVLEAALEPCRDMLLDCGLQLEERRKLPWLRADLMALHIPLPPRLQLDVLPLNNAAKALGCLYVLEGATLGGVLIARHVRASLGFDGDAGSAFYLGYGPRTGAMWRGFCGVLNHTFAHPHARARCQRCCTLGLRLILVSPSPKGRLIVFFVHADTPHGADRMTNLEFGCEREPIHIPGGIQPFGAMFVLHPDDFRVIAASANCLSLVGVEPAAVVGQPIAGVLRCHDVPDIAKFLRAQMPGGGAAVLQVSPHGSSELLCHAFVRIYGGRILVELERATPTDAIIANRLQLWLHQTITQLENADRIKSLSRTVAQKIRRCTGFDRVMVYRFDKAWNGQVIAESCAKGVDSYLGQRFPASDIPAQVREMLRLNRLRMIPDTTYNAVPMIPSRPLGEPIDMGLSLLRSVSPVHLEYLQNMGVGGSLTVSLLQEGRLWGLIACHHRTPKRVDYETRNALELLGQLISALLPAKTQIEQRASRQRLAQRCQQFRTALRGDVDFNANVKMQDDSLAGLLGIEGASVGVHLGDEWLLVGQTPSHAELDLLLDWLQETHPGEDVFYTDQLPLIYPPAVSFCDRASGMLAMRFPQGERAYILWFLEEAVHTVDWAGVPSKLSVQTSEETARLSPRKSFALWRETVRFRSVPFPAYVSDVSANLRQMIVEWDLARQCKLERKATRARDQVLRVVSHDLRNPISAISINVRRLHKLAAQSVSIDHCESLQKPLIRIEKCCQRMDELVESLLDVSKIEAGVLAIKKVIVPVHEFLNDVYEALEANSSERQLQFSVQKCPEIHCMACDPERLLQVFSNLIGNAIKFTPPGGAIGVGFQLLENTVVFSVQDSGPGIAPEDQEHVFDRFWQAERSGRHGSGLGLAIAQGIVQAHGGKLWLKTAHGEGTTFFFSLPLALGAQPYYDA